MDYIRSTSIWWSWWCCEGESERGVGCWLWVGILIGLGLGRKPSWFWVENLVGSLFFFGLKTVGWLWVEILEGWLVYWIEKGRHKGWVGLSG